MRSRIAEALRALITLRGLQWFQRFEWGQSFSGHAQIDALVYELCGLTDEEMAVLEGRD